MREEEPSIRPELEPIVTMHWRSHYELITHVVGVGKYRSDGGDPGDEDKR